MVFEVTSEEMAQVKKVAAQIRDVEGTCILLPSGFAAAFQIGPPPKK